MAFCMHRALMHPVFGRKKASATKFASAFAPRTTLGIRFRDLVGRLLQIEFVADFVVGRDLRDDIELPDYELGSSRPRGKDGLLHGRNRGRGARSLRRDQSRQIKGLRCPDDASPFAKRPPRQRSQLHSFQLEALSADGCRSGATAWHRLSNYCLRASSSSCRSPCWPHGAGSGLRVDNNARSRVDNAGPPADHATPRARDATLPVHDDEREKRSPPSEACCGASALPYGNVTTLLPHSERSLRTNVNEKRFCWLPAHLPPLPELVLLPQLVFRSELAWTQSPPFWREPGRPRHSSRPLVQYLPPPPSRRPSARARDRMSSPWPLSVFRYYSWHGKPDRSLPPRGVTAAQKWAQHALPSPLLVLLQSA